MATRKSRKNYPKGRPMALYAYVSRGAFKFAKGTGREKFKSISRYIEALIQRDMGLRGKVKKKAKKAARKSPKKKSARKSK